MSKVEGGPIDYIDYIDYSFAIPKEICSKETVTVQTSAEYCIYFMYRYVLFRGGILSRVK